MTVTPEKIEDDILLILSQLNFPNVVVSRKGGRINVQFGSHSLKCSIEHREGGYFLRSEDEDENEIRVMEMGPAPYPMAIGMFVSKAAALKSLEIMKEIL